MDMLIVQVGTLSEAMIVKTVEALQIDRVEFSVDLYFLSNFQKGLLNKTGSITLSSENLPIEAKNVCLSR